MLARYSWLALLLFSLGCQSVGTVTVSPQVRQSRQLWEQGHAASQRGDVDQAIHCYEQSLAADPRQEEGHLILAAAYLDKQDEAKACPHLAQYLAVHPDKLGVRVRYAELLLHLQHLPESRTEFERFIAAAQEQPVQPKALLLQCHSRLMEIAEAQGDEYSEHLHRGIGMLLLAEVRPELAEKKDDVSREELLCRSAGELGLAHVRRREEARPCWYLYEVWSRLGQRKPALHWLRMTEAAEPFSYLTPHEKLGLDMAWRKHDLGGARK